MSPSEEEITREAGETKRAVRLRVAERRQITMVVQCPDDLVGAEHPVRMVMALVETLDLSRFAEPIKARGRLSTKLCLRESCGSLEAGLEHGIELVKHGTDGPARSFPSALLQRGDSQAKLEL